MIATAGILAQCDETPQQNDRVKLNPGRIDYRGRLMLRCQLSNYRDGDKEGEGVIGELKR